MKKVLAMLLVLTLVLVPVIGLTGCSGDNTSAGTTATTTAATTKGTSTTAATTTAPTGPVWELGNVTLPIVESPIYPVFGITMHNDDVYDLNLGFPQEMYKRTNIVWDLIAFIGDTATEQKNVLLASGDIPDMLTLDIAQANLYGGMDQMFMPVDEFFDYMPNFMATVNMNDFIPYRNGSDGLMYGVPRSYGLLGNVEYSQDWRRDQLEDLGISEPKNVDEMYTALVAAKEKYTADNDLYVPLISLGWSFDGTHFGPVFDFAKIYGNVGCTYETRNDYTVQYLPTSPEYKNLVTFITKLYAEKIIRQNYMNQQYEDWWDKGMCAGNGFMAIGPNMTRCALATTAAANAGLTDVYWYPGTYMENSSGVRAPMIASGPWVNYLYCLSADTEYAKEIMLLCDYMYTPDGHWLKNAGIEGKHYKWSEADNYPQPLSQDGKLIAWDDSEGKLAAQKWMQSEMGSFFNFFDDYSQNHVPNPSSYPQQWDNYNNNIPLVVHVPQLATTQDLLEEYQTIVPDLDTAFGVARDEFTTGKRSLDEWDAYVTELEGLGCGRVTEIVQVWMDNYKALAA